MSFVALALPALLSSSFGYPLFLPPCARQSSWAKHLMLNISLIYLVFFPFFGQQNMYIKQQEAMAVSLTYSYILILHSITQILSRVNHFRKSHFHYAPSPALPLMSNQERSSTHSKPQRRLQVSRKLRESFRLRRVRASDNGRFAGVRVGADLCVQRDVPQESDAELFALLLSAWGTSN